MAEDFEWSEQRKLRWEADEQKKREEQEKERQLKKNGENWAQEMRAKGFDDLEVIKEVLEIAAEQAAKRSTQAGRTQPVDNRFVVDEALEKLSRERAAAELKDRIAAGQLET